MSKISHNPTTMIKSKFSNEVHKLLDPNMGTETRDRWRLPKKKLTDAEKLELFEKIVEANNTCTAELTAYQYDRRVKNRVKKARIARGWVPKVKTKKVA